MTTPKRSIREETTRRVAARGASVAGLATALAIATGSFAAAGEAPGTTSGHGGRCWTPPAGAVEAGITVTLRVEFDRGGSVVGTPRVIEAPATPLGRALVDSARRALVRCGPYRMPAGNYEKWHWIEMKFDPRNL